MICKTNLLRTLVLAGVAASLAPAPAHAQDLPPARQIVDAYMQAIGGTEAIARASHRHFKGEMSMPAAGMTMSMEMWQSRPNKMLMVMSIPGMGEMRQGYDGQTAWSSNPMQGPRIIEGAEMEQTVRQADFDASHPQFSPLREERAGRGRGRGGLLPARSLLHPTKSLLRPVLSSSSSPSAVARPCAGPYLAPARSNSRTHALPHSRTS